MFIEWGLVWNQDFGVCVAVVPADDSKSVWLGWRVTVNTSGDMYTIAHLLLP